MIKLSKSLEVEFVSVSLAVDFGHDVFVVIVTERTAKFIVVHVWFVFAFSPPTCDLIGVGQFEFAIVAFPGDEAGV